MIYSIDASLHEIHEQWMWMQHRGRILGMELGADVPTQGWDLHNLHEVGRWVDAHALHPVALELI